MSRPRKIQRRLWWMRDVPPSKRKRVFARDGYKRLACGATERLSIDHKIPKSKGGSCDESNLQTLCVLCNLSKKNTTMEEFMAAGGAQKRHILAAKRAARLEPSECWTPEMRARAARKQRLWMRLRTAKKQLARLEAQYAVIA